jgi:hypothetical protein
MLGPVHWGSYPGEYLELAMAVLVAQDHPDTLRRVPASGDGGIDLMVPDGPGYEIRQVKRFTQRIRDAERKQIEASWRTLRSDPRLSRPITRYRLVVPVDPTPDEQAWFDELVAEAPWPATWWGATQWHVLASRHPHVIDYFFGGGRERVAQRSRALQASIVDPSQPLWPSDFATSVTPMLTALNSDDPHYHYELRTYLIEPTIKDVEKCVMAETRRLPDGSYLTILVRPRHRYSLSDAPIQGTLTVDITDPEVAAQFREAFTAFQHFGRAVDLPEGMVSVQVTAPGGLGGTFEGGGGRILPVSSNIERSPLRLVVSDRRNVLAELVLAIHNVTTGPAGGAEIHLADPSNLLAGVLQISPPDGDGGRVVRFSFDVGDITGRPVLQVLPALRLLALIRPGNELQLRPQYGNQVVARTVLEEHYSYVTEGGLAHLEDLSVLQSYAANPILVTEEIDRAFAAELHELVQMLRGESIAGTWNDVTLSIAAGVGRSGLMATLTAPGALAMDQEISVHLDGQDIALGRFTTILHSATLAKEQPEDILVARLIPAGDRTFVRRAGPLLVE